MSAPRPDFQPLRFTADAEDHAETIAPDKPLLVMVDDRPVLLKGLILEIHRVLGADWQVLNPTSPEETFALMSRLAPRIPDLVSVDLGLEPEPDDCRIGLQLLHALHERFHGVRLAVHTSQKVHAGVVHEIVTIPASYVRLHDRHAVEAYVQMLPFMVEGFLVYSPTMASRVSDAVVVNPDPFDADDWRMIARFANGDSYNKVADLDHVTVSAINGRVKKLVDILVKRGFVTPTEGQEKDQNNLKQTLVTFYRAHHVRYGH